MSTATTHKYIILFGKFGRHEDAAGNVVGPEHGGQLVTKRPGDIVDLTIEQAEAKQLSVRLAVPQEIEAYERRMRGETDAPPAPEQVAQAPGSGPLGSQAETGTRLAEPAAPAKPAATPVAATATAQAPAPATAAPAAPAIPAAAPAPGPAGVAAPSAIPAAAPDNAGKPRARSQGKGKGKGGKKGSSK